MTVLVTGAGGFLGRHVVEDLVARGIPVRALLRPAGGPAPAEWRDGVEVMRADLRDVTALPALLKGVEAVVHLAAAVRGTPEAQFAGTVVATERLLAALVRTGARPHVVLAGSLAVYDWSGGRGTLDEDTPLEPRLYERDGYAIAKGWQERIVRRCAQAHDLPLAVLRPGFIHGEQCPEVPGAGVRLGRVFAVVAPTARLPLTHVRRCAAAFGLAVERRAAGTFNVIDDEPVSAWRHAGTLRAAGRIPWRVPVPYALGLGLAFLATGVSRVLFPPRGGRLPGILIPRRYRARFRPMRFPNERIREALGWSGARVQEGRP